MSDVVVKYNALAPSAIRPRLAHPTDAGFDLYTLEDFTLGPQGETKVICTGIAIELPDGMCGLVVPRSGLAARDGITVANAPGIIDAGYRGEIKVILINHSSRPKRFFGGDRIAQLVIIRAFSPWLVEVDVLSDSPRGIRGLGSTGA